jgi:hypothetical protein
LLIESAILTIGLAGFAYAFYCQTKVRRHISREKVAKLEDVSILATGPMPPKEIISDEGLKYHRGFRIGSAMFVVSLILLMALSQVSGR